jgi:hypothetical protein
VIVVNRDGGRVDQLEPWSPPPIPQEDFLWSLKKKKKKKTVIILIPPKQIDRSWFLPKINMSFLLLF